MFNDIISKIKDVFSPYFKSISQKVFGKNNENLDFILDSFYKLPPQQRDLFLGGFFAVIICCMLGLVGVYFSRVNSLQNEMNQSFSALSDLRRVIAKDSVNDKKYDYLVKSITKKTRNLNYKPFFEKLSKKNNVTIKNLNVEKAESLPGDPLAKEVQEYNIEMKIPKISLPKILKFLIDIEKSRKYLRVKDLKILGMYGTKLYFDVVLVVRAYSVAR